MNVQAKAVAEVFTTFPGQCYRFFDDDDGQPRHCTGRAVHTGRFTDAGGSTWTVDACEEHAGELSSVRPPTEI